jgi:hypothetical protein
MHAATSSATCGAARARRHEACPISSRCSREQA